MSVAVAQGPDEKPLFTHRWVLRRVLPDRYHQLCRIVPKEFKRGFIATFASPAERITVAFVDGTTVEASRIAIRSVRRPGWLTPGTGPRRR